jgi:hypothetical protein
MKYEIPNCQNEECHQFSYGSENNCRATESYNDPKKCKDYEPCKSNDNHEAEEPKEKR